MELSKYFARESIDLIVSSECIEHVPDPRQVIKEMASVLKPGGYLSLSTPNRLWQPVVRAATALKLRPFDGYENFLSWGALRDCLRENHLQIQREFGLHLFPFQLGMRGFSRWCDARCQTLRGLMINMCVLARKESGNPQ